MNILNTGINWMKFFNDARGLMGLATAVGVMIVAPASNAIANEGPYIGVNLGYNRVDDQTYDYMGEIRNHILVVELPPQPNSGLAAKNSYDDDFSYQLVGGYSFQSGWRLEMELGYRNNTADNIISYRSARPNDSGNLIDGSGTKISATSIFGNVWYDFFPSWRLHPYLGAGAGFTRFKLAGAKTDRNNFDVRKADDATFSYQAGAGLRFDLTHRWTFGLDYRYLVASPAKFYTYGDQRFTFLESDYKAQTALLSVNYYFRGQAPVQELPPEPVQVVAPLAPVDSDGDGVPDNLDQCPNTPLGEPVDEVGCPLPPPPPPCKTPEAGERVSLSGCGTGDVIVLRGVNFDFNKSSLTANAMRLLDMVADELKANPHIDVEIGGHTDSKGADAYNQRLSEQRAQSVRGYLIGEGVAAGQLSARGYGENNPIADNDTEAGRELNRRVELKIIGTAPARVTRGVNPQVESNAAAQDASLADEPIQEDEDVSGTDDQSAPAANEQSPPNDDLDGLFDF